MSSKRIPPKIIISNAESFLNFARSKRLYNNKRELQRKRIGHFSTKLADDLFLLCNMLNDKLLNREDNGHNMTKIQRNLEFFSNKFVGLL